MDTRLFFLLNMTQKRVFHHVNEQASERLGISVTQVAGLMFVARNEGCVQGELATALGLNKSAASGLAVRLERNGLIVRRPQENDGRAFSLRLTTKAKRLLPKVKPLLAGLNRELTAEFSKDEIDVVTRFLNQTMERFDRSGG